MRNFLFALSFVVVACGGGTPKPKEPAPPPDAAPVAVEKPKATCETASANLVKMQGSGDVAELTADCLEQSPSQECLECVTNAADETALGECEAVCTAQ
jgi:hypothetical protein